MDSTSAEAPQHKTPAIFCPSCAAKIERDAQAGDLITCPVCGTEFKYDPAKSALAEIIDEPEIAAKPESTRRPSTEEILLDRFTKEETPKKPATMFTYAAVFGVIAVAAVAIFFATAKQDAYAPKQGPDTSMVVQRRLMYQHTLDSLRNVVKSNPTDAASHVALADLAYDLGYWDESVGQFQQYLALKPKDADARVDYSYAIAQQSGNLERSLVQIDSALAIDPNHLNALINGGILAAQTVSDSNHEVALDRARSYFERARAIAITKDSSMARRIDTLLSEINRTGARLKAK